MVPWRVGRDDGGDDVPVGGSDGRAVLADDAGTLAARPARVLGRLPRRWGRAGRWVAGATLIVAAAYELTPLKNVCLSKCRSPLGFLIGSWREGLPGALEMGAKNGAWCVGCCWALMASL